MRETLNSIILILNYITLIELHHIDKDIGEGLRRRPIQPLNVLLHESGPQSVSGLLQGGSDSHLVAPFGMAC